MAFRFTKKAQRDFYKLEQDTVEEWGILQAIEYTEQILDSCQLLAEFPQKGRIDEGYEDQETRRFPLKYHIILYRIVDDDIEILAIPHGKQDPKNYLG